MRLSINYLTIVSLMVILAAGCKNSRIESDDSDLLKWLSGERADTTMGFYEGWRSSGDTMFIGYGFQISEGDTIFKEALSIRKTGDTWLYIVQHGSGETSFKLMAAPGDTLIFENPDNDFPKRITYLNKPGNKIVVDIENPGEPDKLICFNFIPIK